MKAEIEELEEQLGDDLPWMSVSAIENFPAASFEEVCDRVEQGQLQLGIDFSLANKLAFQGFYGQGYSLLMAALAWGPYLLAIAFVVAAIGTSQWLLLLGAPVVIAGYLLGNPYNPMSVGIALLGSVAGAIWAWSADRPTLAVVVASFLVTYALNQFIYRMNQSQLHEVVLSSELIFLHLYHDGLLGLRSADGSQPHYYTSSTSQELGNRGGD